MGSSEKKQRSQPTQSNTAKQLNCLFQCVTAP